MLVAVKAAVALVEVALTSTLATSAPPDELATRIALYAGAGAGVAWLFKNVARPVAKVLHRMALAVESLEDLPAWREQIDQRLDRKNRRIRHLELGLGQLASGQQAILRELRIEDKVRQQFTDPAEFERWLEAEGDEES